MALLVLLARSAGARIVASHFFLAAHDLLNLLRFAAAGHTSLFQFASFAAHEGLFQFVG